MGAVATPADAVMFSTYEAKSGIISGVDSETEPSLVEFVVNQGFDGDSIVNWAKFGDPCQGVTCTGNDIVFAEVLSSGNDFTNDTVTVTKSADDPAEAGEISKGTVDFNFTNETLPLPPVDLYFMVWKTRDEFVVTYHEPSLTVADRDLVKFDLKEIYETEQTLGLSHITLYGASRSTSVVPVPAGLPLLLSGLGILGWLGARRRRAAA